MSRVEEQVLHELGTSAILSTGELAALLEVPRDRVGAASRRLYERGLVRRLYRASAKTLWLLPLTGEVLDQTNFALLQELTRSLPRAIDAAWERGQTAVVRAVEAWFRDREEKYGKRLARHRAAVLAAVRRGETKERLLDRLSLVPMHPREAVWWPPALEVEYEARLRPVLARVERPRIRRLEGAARKTFRDARALAEEEPAPEQVKRLLVRGVEEVERLREELDRSGFEALLVEKGPQIQQLIAAETLPADEVPELAEVLSVREMIALAREADLEALAEPPPPAEEIARAVAAEPGPEGTPRPRRRPPRWWAFRGLELSGGMLEAAGDVLAALHTGGAGEVASLAGLPVHSAIAHTGSVFTGLTLAWHSFRQMRVGTD